MNLYQAIIISPFGLVFGGGLFVLPKNTIVTWLGDHSQTPEIRISTNKYGTLKIKNFKLKNKSIAQIILESPIKLKVTQHPH